MPRSWRGGRLATLLVVASGCGASYQSVYEGDVRFEHCYRLDADPTISREARLACWSEWTRRYTAGQTLDRVDYALSRERALMSGDTRTAGPTLSRVEAPKPLETAHNGHAVAAPLPSTPFVSPPPTMPVASAPPAASAALSAPTGKPELTPSQACVRDCGDGFTECATKCKKPGCVNRCGEIAKVCIGECL